MGIVTRRDSRYFWLNIERPGLPPLRESTRILCRGLPPPVLRENRLLAEQVYNTRLGDLARQRHGVSVERPRASFRAFAGWYLAHVTPGKRTAARETSAVGHLVAHFGRQPLERLDADAVREYVTARRATVKASTVNREIDVLKSMLSAAVPKYLDRNPLLGLRRLRARAPEARVLTFDEEARLREVLTPPNVVLLTCALDALLRLGDIVRLTWSQDRGTYLDVWDPKGEPYRPTISTRLRAGLDTLERRGRRVFHHLADENAVIRMFADACHRAGVPHGRPHGVTFHSLRHTGATRAIQAGATLRDLQALGGWRDIKSVMRYTRPTTEDRALVDRMSRPVGARDVHAGEDGQANS